LIVSDFKNQKR